MPEVVAEALVELRPTVDEARTRAQIKQAVDRAERGIPPIDVPVDERGMNQKFASIGKGIKALFAIEGAQRAAQFVGSIAEQSSDLAEAINAAGVQFQGAQGDVLEWAETTAYGLGISNAAALEAAAGFAGMLDNLKLAPSTVADLSEGLVQVAADLASLRNLSTDDALTKIRSGLAGETEPLRAFGVNLTEVAVQSKAVQLGIAEVGDQLTENEKLVARAAIITSELSEAQGDSANTAGEFAGAMRRLKATSTDLAASFGSELTPQLSEFSLNLAFLADKLAKADDKTGDFTDKLKGLEFGPAGAVITVLNLAVSEWRERSEEAAEGSETYADANKALADSIDQLNASVLDTTESLTAQADAMLGAADADLARRSAALSVADADDKLAQAQQDVNDALSGGGQYAKDQTRALEKLEDAHEALADSQERVRRLTLDLSDAQEAAAEAAFHFGAGSREARDANREVEELQFDVGVAQEDVGDRQQDVLSAEGAAATVSRSQAVEEATRKLEKARIDLESAVLRAATAEGTFAEKSELAENKQASELATLQATRDAMQTYADKLEGPVKTALLGRIADLDIMIARMQTVEQLAAGATFAAEPPQVGAGDLGGPGAPQIGAGDLGGSGTVGSGGLSSGAVGGGNLGGGSPGTGGGGGPVTVNFNYPVPAEQTAAYIEQIARVRR